MQIRLMKGKPDEVRFKYSQSALDFYVLKVGNKLRSGDEVIEPTPLYNLGPLKLSKAKYDDLHSLCTGNTPVVANPEYQSFFSNLPH